MIAALLAAAVAGAGVSYEYRVEAGEGARELAIEARFSAVPSGCLEVGRGLEAFAVQAQIRRGRRWRALERINRCFDVPAGRDVRVRYRFELARAASLGDRARRLHEDRGALFAPPTVWLLRPAAFARGRYRLRVAVPAGWSFVTGLSRVGEDAWEGRAEFLDGTPYAVFTPTAPSLLPVPGGEIEWVVTPGDLPVPREALVRWIEGAARAMAGYFGRFPVPRAAVIVVPPASGRRGGGGSTMGYGGAAIRVGIGRGVADGTDWVLAHEMVHLGFPNLAPEQRWMEEGLATYVEPLARVRAGQLSAEEAWKGFVQQMPHARPDEGDVGLDQTSALDGGWQRWGRTYWGGALYWLRADVELLERTRGRVGLPEVLAGLLREGGDIRERWDVGAVLAASERVAGVPVLRELYTQLARQAGTTDLDALWARLGVVKKEGGVLFDDDAPQAWIRRRITSGEGAPAGETIR